MLRFATLLHKTVRGITLVDWCPVMVSPVRACLRLPEFVRIYTSICFHSRVRFLATIKTKFNIIVPRI